MKRRLGADPKKPVLLLSAPLVIPVTGPAIADGAVAVQGARVLHVGTRQWVLAKLQEELEDAALVHERSWRGIITPGLVNAHTHLEYTGMQSVGQRTYPTFRQWELAFNRIYDSPEKKPWKAWAHEGARQLVRAGTTAAADIVSDVEAADALVSQGLHGISYWEVMDWTNDDWKARARRRSWQISMPAKRKAPRRSVSRRMLPIRSDLSRSSIYPISPVLVA